MEIKGNKLIIGTKELQNAIGEDSGELVVEERSRWNVDGKYETRAVYLRHVPTGLIFRAEVSRSGSAFSEYIYCWEWDSMDKIYTLPQFRRTEKIVVVWEEVSVSPS
jgi:hypothetical protein